MRATAPAIYVAVFVLVAGCGAGATPTPPSTTVSPSGVTVSTPGAESSGPMAGRSLFSGTYDCGFPDGISSTTNAGVTTHTGKIRCTLDASDSRASGIETADITMSEIELSGFHVNKWFDRGTWKGALTNGGGVWRNTEAFGVDQWDASGNLHTAATAAYIGEGGYSGLRMRLLYAQGTSESAPAYVVVGWIEPEP